MFETLRHSLNVGVVTTDYPRTPAPVSPQARGRPAIDWEKWTDARRAAAVCPTGAITVNDTAGVRRVGFDLGQCIFCGLCAEADGAIRMTNQCELAVRTRSELVTEGRYELRPDGTQARLLEPPASAAVPDDVAAAGEKLRRRIRAVLGRSLHIREVDAGSCNGCEVEINALGGPVYDLERFGVHLVASPRHADMLLVTGPVTRNMELALRKTYVATPEPRLVVAVGACGCSGGIFGRNYATCGGIDAVLPVDVYIPGCPPNPVALLHGILLAIGRLEKR